MMERPTEPVHTGGCQCGAVRYEIYVPLRNAHLCHCRMCQKAVGGPFAALANVRVHEFDWAHGAPAIFESSNRLQRGFCRDCGTPLTAHPVNTDRTNFTIGSLDDPGRVPPVVHVGWESHVDWLELADTLPRQETVAPGAGADGDGAGGVFRSNQHRDTRD